VTAVLLDDLEAALCRLAPLGRRLVEPSVLPLREALLRDAERRGWPVVSYAAFVASTRALPPGSGPWVVLDKLFPEAAVPGRCVRCDVHRSWAGEGPEVLSPRLALRESRWEGIDAFDGALPVTVLDDAAYTGATVRAAASRVARHGGTVRRVVLGVARRRVAAELQEAGVDVSCHYLTEGREDILHLRDFSPWLPFSGREIAGRAVLPGPGGAPLPLRLAPSRYAAGRWLHLEERSPLRPILDEAARAFVETLRSHLGREPRISDLGLLGKAVAVPLSSPEQEAEESLPLRGLLA